MPIQDKEARKSYNRRYELTHKDAIKKRKHLYYLANRERLLQVSSDYKKTHREIQRESYLRWTRKYKDDVLKHYGNGELACVGCGYSNVDCLTIDHLNNDGYEHRRAEGITGDKIYRWLRKNNYPKGFQTLCMNCQFIKRKTKQTPNLKGRYVLLSEDQSLPEIPRKDIVHIIMERDIVLLQANFKRIEK